MENLVAMRQEGVWLTGVESIVDKPYRVSFDKSEGGDSLVLLIIIAALGCTWFK